MTTLKLDARALDILRTACTFAAVDNCRYYINAVRIETEGTRCRVIATDTHQMFVGCVESFATLELPKAAFSIPAAQLKEALSAFKAKRDLFALFLSFDGEALAQDEKEGVCLSEVAITFTGYYVDKTKKTELSDLIKKESPKKAPILLGHFVEYKRAIPIPDAATRPANMSISARLLENISRAAISLNENKRALSPIQLYTATDYGAAVTALAPDAIAVVMPMRAGDECSYWSAYNKIF